MGISVQQATCVLPNEEIPFVLMPKKVTLFIIVVSTIIKEYFLRIVLQLVYYDNDSNKNGISMEELVAKNIKISMELGLQRM